MMILIELIIQLTMILIKAKIGTPFLKEIKTRLQNSIILQKASKTN
jgi:hypothetical protein